LERDLIGRAEIKDFRADEPQGSDWYRRAMRAHANCLENLPLYTAVVVAIAASGVRSVALDRLAIVLLAARVCQTIVHIALTPSNDAAICLLLYSADLHGSDGAHRRAPRMNLPKQRVTEPNDKNERNNFRWAKSPRS
jgi:uncharacterized MAPEG superfamily protein